MNGMVIQMSPVPKSPMRVEVFLPKTSAMTPVGTSAKKLTMAMMIQSIATSVRVNPRFW